MSRFTRAGAAAAALATLAMVPAGAGAAPLSTGHSSWTWGSPTPQGQYLDAVSFDGQDGFAGGDFGTLLRSTDGGATWTGLSTGLTAPITVIDEVSPSVVLAGGSCQLAISTDSGATFAQIPLNLGDCDNDGVTGLAFTDAQHGEIALEDGSILSTADGGQTLQEQADVTGNDSSAVTAMHFMTPSVGLVATSAGSTSGQIQRTTDGGNSWSVVEQGPDGILGLTVVDATHAFAVSATGKMYASSDAGATWQPVPLTLASGAKVPGLTGITCADAQTCLITTAEGGIIRTADGGQTGTLATAGTTVLEAAAFTTGTNVVAVGDGGATVQSADGGATFPSVAADPLAKFVANGNLVAGDAAGTAYQPGDSGQIAATTNAGTSWSALTVPDGGDDVQSVAFPTAQTGYALDDSGVLYTTANGGSSWRSFAARHSTRAQLIAAGSSVLLVGPNGVQRSTDGGQSFTAVGGAVHTTHGPGTAIAKLRLTGARVVGQTVIAWGPRGIIASTNGGQTWRAIPAPPLPTISEVAFIGTQHLWAIGPQGNALYASTDGGHHWQSLDGIGGGLPLSDVSFSTPQDGIAALGGDRDALDGTPFDAAAMLVTHDGGHTWQPELLNGTGGSEAVATPSADYATSSTVGLSDNRSSSVTSFFATTDGGTSGARRSLTLSLAKRKESAAALAKAKNKVTLKGHLASPQPQEQVLLTYRNARHVWTERLVRVATGGDFTATVRGIRATTVFVAQAVGDGSQSGAGTAPVTFTVTP